MSVLALADGTPALFDMATGEGHAADLVGAWLVCFFTLAVYSFLYRDNPFYKVAEHVFVGVGTAWLAMEFYDSGIVDPIYEYFGTASAALGASDPEPFKLGGYIISPLVGIVVRCGALLFSAMLLSRLFIRNAWPSRWPLAVMVGVYAALKMTGETQSKLVTLVRETFNPLTNPLAVPWSEAVQIEQTQIWAVLTRLIFLVGMLCVLAHFVFTYRRTKVLSGASRVGILVLMVTFGSMFGFTVLGRIALLIKRIAQLKSFSTDDYSVAASAGPGFSAAGVLTSPPMLLGALIVLVLAAAALQSRGRPTSTPA